jgi:hypothetical protein
VQHANNFLRATDAVVCDIEAREIRRSQRIACTDVGWTRQFLLDVGNASGTLPITSKLMRWTALWRFNRRYNASTA